MLVMDHLYFNDSQVTASNGPAV